MSTKSFLTRLASELVKIGVDAKFDGYCCVVDGVKFGAEDGKKEGRIRFLDSSFKVADDGEFDVKKAIGLLVSELPIRRKHLDVRKAVEELTNYKFVDNVAMTYYRIDDDTAVAAHKNGTALRFICQDIDTVNRIRELVKQELHKPS